jgi:hypothetical protein
VHLLVLAERQFAILVARKPSYLVYVTDTRTGTNNLTVEGLCKLLCLQRLHLPLPHLGDREPPCLTLLPNLSSHPTCTRTGTNGESLTRRLRLKD